MSHADQDAALDAALKTMRIIVGALAVGVVNFLGIALFIRSQNAAAPPEVPILSWVAVGCTALALALHVFLPGWVTKHLRQKLVQGKVPPVRINPAFAALPNQLGFLMGIYQTQMLVGAALVEGASFLSLIAYLLEGEWFSLLLAGLLLVVLIAKFPSHAGFALWLERQRELIEQERFDAASTRND
jgi:hypothetical protein